MSANFVLCVKIFNYVPGECQMTTRLNTFLSIFNFVRIRKLLQKLLCPRTGLTDRRIFFYGPQNFFVITIFSLFTYSVCDDKVKIIADKNLHWYSLWIFKTNFKLTLRYTFHYKLRRVKIFFKFEFILTKRLRRWQLQTARSIRALVPSRFTSVYLRPTYARELTRWGFLILRTSVSKRDLCKTGSERGRERERECVQVSR